MSRNLASALLELCPSGKKVEDDSPEGGSDRLDLKTQGRELRHPECQEYLDSKVVGLVWAAWLMPSTAW